MSEETITTPNEERTPEEIIETPKKKATAKPAAAKAKKPAAETEEKEVKPKAKRTPKAAAVKEAAAPEQPKDAPAEVAPSQEKAEEPAPAVEAAPVETPEAPAEEKAAEPATAVEAAAEAAKLLAKAGQMAAEEVAEAIKDGGEVLQEKIEEAKETIHLSDEYLQELASKSLKEITEVFQNIVDKADQQEMYKYAEAIKASFYKALKRDKIAAGFQAPAEPAVETVETPSEEEQPETQVEETAETTTVSVNPFAEIERGFKDLYGRYKSMRASYLQDMERKKEDNLQTKLQIIDELKSLLETQEDLNRTFPAFRALQARWRESGPVPQNKVKDVYDTYQHYIEMFYDYVKINNELRDLDFKKNLEAKEDLCVKAEALIGEENVVNAFAKLQKLHEEWKNFGPVDKEHRESIWDRFKAATSLINKKHQEHFEGLKEGQKENLEKKTVLCEKAEAISVREIPESNGWNDASKELENLQKEWKTIGFASKKDNQKIYDRFRAACDAFYNRKREYYSQFKDQMTQNMEKKLSLCEKAEQLKESTEWKKTTDAFIALQKEWKEIGPVSRKKSEQIWSRFRAACDSFFDNKEKNFGGVDPQYVENLNGKKAIIEEVNAFVSDGNRENDIRAMKEFFNKWNEIGFVPFKEKDKIQEEFRAAIDAHFAEYRSSEGRGRRPERGGRGQSRPAADPVRSEREKLLTRFRKIESEIATYENNMGFFASSKNADAFIKEINKKIEAAKAELKELEEKIKSIDKQFE